MYRRGQDDLSALTLGRLLDLGLEETRRSLLDGIVRRGSQLVRRGRWLQMLANAALRWDTPQGTGSPERTLCIIRGRVQDVAKGSAGKDLTTLVPAKPPRMARRKIFASTATYDRLSVLTTELRRLLTEDRGVTLVPVVGAPLGRKGLERWLSLI